MVAVSAGRPSGRVLRGEPSGGIRQVHPERAAAAGFRGELSGECRMSILGVRRPATYPGCPPHPSEGGQWRVAPDSPSIPHPGA